MSNLKSFYEILTIESNDGSKSIDLIDGAVAFDYYEDIFSPVITAKLKVINVGNTVDDGSKRQSLYDGLPLRGGERLALKMTPNKEGVQSFLDFSQPDQYFVVSSITDVIMEQNRESFTLNLTSREAITNETSRVFKRYPAENKISDAVKSILEENLVTENINEIEGTSNVYGFLGNLRKPFTVLVWLASKSVPESEGGNAGFVFYQTKQGFNFRSLDSLTQQEPYKEKYVYAQSNPAFEENTKINNDYKILSYFIDRNQNLIEKLRLGAYASWRMYFNPLDFSVTIPEAGYYTSEAYKDSVKTLGAKPVFPPISPGSDKTLADVPTRIFSSILDIGTLTQEVTKDNNADPSEYQAQTLMRYNSLLTQSLSVMIPCNVDLNAGDVIECLFPLVTDSVDKKEYDEEISGLYMIKELCHHFDASSSYTSLKLVRDTFGVQER
jgi:hypothetical protein